MHKVKLTWAELCEILQKNGRATKTFEILPEEEITGITLVKPRELLIWAEKKPTKWI